MMMRSFKFVIFLACLCASLVHAEALVGQVIAVSDGDTIKVLDDTKKLFVIRLVGIDAPEKAQSFGQKSKKSLSELVFNSRVEVQWSKRDRYERIVGKVISADGSDVGLVQITRGMAWHYKQYANEQSIEDRHKYSQAEETTKDSRVGLWAEPQPVPPWVWRKNNR
jgi:endonuclease YncB( thermonuclease family)